MSHREPETVERITDHASRIVPADRLRDVVGFLAGISCWFEVMPLPYDVYRVTVKAENGEALKAVLGC